MLQHIVTSAANIALFTEPMRAISWAPFGGGVRNDVRAVVNWNVEGVARPLEDLKDEVFAHLNLEEEQTVILFTAVPSRYCFDGNVREERTGLEVKVLATAGLGNGRAFTDPPEWDEEREDGHPFLSGTINLIVSVNRRLTVEAHLELMAIVAQIKTHVVESFGLLSSLSGSVCSGTGTDCIVVCAPEAHQIRLKYAGMHTVLRRVAVQATTLALQPAIRNWQYGRMLPMIRE